MEVKAIDVPEIDEEGNVSSDHFEIEHDRTNVGFTLNDTAIALQRAYDDEHDDGKVVEGIYTRNHPSDATRVLLGGTFVDPPEGYEPLKSRLQNAESPVNAAQDLQRSAEKARADEPSQYSAGQQAEVPEESEQEKVEEESGGDDQDGDYDPTNATVDEIKAWAAQETSRSALNRALRKERAGQARVTAIDAMESARDAAEMGS